MAVNTAVDTRETQEWHRIQVRILPGIAASFACETQDFASLLARMRNKLRRLCACHYRIFCPGDARFCVSTGLTPLLF